MLVPDKELVLINVLAAKMYVLYEKISTSTIIDFFIRINIY
jgi:hypothetical protein